MANVVGTYTDTPVFSFAYSGPFSTPVGTTKRTGSPDAPTRVKVILFDQLRGNAVRSLWSAAETGVWQVHGLTAGTYFAMAFDHTGAYNGEVVTDIVVPAP